MKRIALITLGFAALMFAAAPAFAQDAKLKKGAEVFTTAKCTKCHSIAGKGIANPLGAIASVAMLLRYGLKQPEAADQVDGAVSAVLASGARTEDIARPEDRTVGTREIGEMVVREVRRTRTTLGASLASRA